MQRLACSLFLTATFLAATVLPAFAHKENKAKRLRHAAYHEVTMVDRDATGKIIGGGTCSSTAVGPHTLLLAEHCNDRYTAEVYVDESEDAVRANTARTYSALKQFDHQDHMLLDLAQITFSAYVPLSVVAPPVQGEHFYFWGSPQGMRDEYRESYITGMMPFDRDKDDPEIDASGPVYMAVGPIQPGDSGSVLFDSKTGKIIGVVTYGIGEGLFMGIFPLQFTPAQLAQSLQSVVTVDQPAPRPPDTQGAPNMFRISFSHHTGGSRGQGGGHSSPRPPARGPGGYHGNPNVKQHYHNGRFDHDYYIAHFGVYHPFYIGGLFWYGPAFAYESVFVFDDCGFMLSQDLPGEWQPEAVYIVEVNGLYYVANPNMPGLISVQVIF
jgi:hypothetical protein